MKRWMIFSHVVLPRTSLANTVNRCFWLEVGLEAKQCSEVSPRWSIVTMHVRKSALDYQAIVVWASAQKLSHVDTY